MTFISDLEHARAAGRAEGLRLAASLLEGSELLKDAAEVLVALAEDEDLSWCVQTQTETATAEPDRSSTSSSGSRDS
jgi:hypothetical protein